MAKGQSLTVFSLENQEFQFTLFANYVLFANLYFENHSIYSLILSCSPIKILRVMRVLFDKSHYLLIVKLHIFLLDRFLLDRSLMVRSLMDRFFLDRSLMDRSLLDRYFLIRFFLDKCLLHKNFSELIVSDKDILT